MYLSGYPARFRMADGGEIVVDHDGPEFLPMLDRSDATAVNAFGQPYQSTKAGQPGQQGVLWNGCPTGVTLEEENAHGRNTWLLGQIEYMKAAGMAPGCLVPGSPNYNAWWGVEGLTPQSGEGMREVVSFVMPSPAPAVPGRPAALPSGISTPTITPLPGGSASYVAPALNPPPQGQAAPADYNEMIGWAGLAIGILALFSSRR